MDEIIFVGTAEAEHVEMYLKAIGYNQEKNYCLYWLCNINGNCVCSDVFKS